MSYSQRVWIATGVSIVVHLALLWVSQSRVDAIPKGEAEPSPTPITFNFEPPPPAPEPEPEISPVRRLIETLNPTTEPVEDTDLISNNDSKAADRSEETSDRAAPASDNIDDFDEVNMEATQNPQVSPPQPIIPPPLQPETPPAEESVEEVEQPEESTEPIEEPTPEPEPEPEPETLPEDMDGELAIAREEVETQEEEESAAEEVQPAEPQPEERFEVAQATPPPVPETFVQDVRTGRTRENGGTDRNGDLNFEARQHVLGEYMLGVRRKVERSWRSAVRIKYANVRHAETRVKLSIRPDGTIASVEIVDQGTSFSFAALSREAVQQAGPFEPLPFDVPEIYRSRNLEITWRFTYN